jgi:hypothetical protein
MLKRVLTFMELKLKRSHDVKRTGVIEWRMSNDDRSSFSCCNCMMSMLFNIIETLSYTPKKKQNFRVVALFQFNSLLTSCIFFSLSFPCFQKKQWSTTSALLCTDRSWRKVPCQTSVSEIQEPSKRRMHTNHLCFCYSSSLFYSLLLKQDSWEEGYFPSARIRRIASIYRNVCVWMLFDVCFSFFFCWMKKKCNALFTFKHLFFFFYWHTRGGK